MPVPQAAGMTRTTPTTTTSTAADRLLDAVRIPGTSVGDIYGPDSVFDATVPGWRFTVRGAPSIGYQFAEWFHCEGTFEELVRQPTACGEVIEYTMAWEEDGAPYAAHHVHVLTVDSTTDRIVEDHMWCGGRWPASVLAQMEAARHDR
jgi:hypothetical protein